MQVKGCLVVAQQQWKNVYRSILNYVNEEVLYSYNEALKIYKSLQEAEVTSFSEESLQPYLSETYTDFHVQYILSSLSSGKSTRVYKPKKTHFKKFTNRTREINLLDFKITFDKVTNTVNFTSADLDCTEPSELTSKYNFLGQFVNMVETIPWPSRRGRKTTLRGCNILYLSSETEDWCQFYSQGTNPPTFDETNTIVVPEPKFLKTSPLSSLKITPPIVSETHTNPVLRIVDKEFI